MVRDPGLEERESVRRVAQALIGWEHLFLVVQPELACPSSLRLGLYRLHPERTQPETAPPLQHRHPLFRTRPAGFAGGELPLPALRVARCRGLLLKLRL